MYPFLLGILLAGGAVNAAPLDLATSEEESVVTRRASKFPFTRVVAFGDSLTDNGNGSVAHCVQSTPGQDCSNSIYGYNTWTDGPVAVSYLVDMLGVPLAQDYAFGGAEGGSKLGATIEQSYTPTNYSQSGQQQIQNYTSSANYQAKIGQTLHFLWIGNNDINLLHLSTSTSNNPNFASQMSKMMVTLVGTLINAGAPYVFVPSLYAKHISPSWQFYASNANERKNLGLAIKQANTAIEAALKSAYGSKVIWHDVFTPMVDMWNNHNDYGIKYVGKNFCDGYSQEDWNICVVQHHGDQFYWMQYLDPTTHVHQLLAQGMYQTINAAFS